MATSDCDAPLKPLDIKCTSTACDKGLHCFRATARMVDLNHRGRCRSCGIELVDWGRVHGRRLDDVNYTFDMLRYELIRHHYWHLQIDAKARNHAKRKGKIALKEAAAHVISKKIVPAMPTFDGRQTPRAGNSIFYAQHAVAACCRKCVEEWHGIPQGRELTIAETEYLVGLVWKWLDERLPELAETGQRVPVVRKTTATVESRA